MKCTVLSGGTVAALRIHYSHIRWFFRGVIGLVLLSGLMVHLSITAWAYSYFDSTLNDPNRLVNNQNRGVTLLDREGRPFFTLLSPNLKQPVLLADMSAYLSQALVAMEDKEFYDHKGYSLRAIAAAFVTNAQEGAIKRGGSTLTQQLVKTTLLTPTKSYLRKYQEVVLATQVEDRYTKDEILTMYLNTVYFGEGAYGAEQAARSYFNKSAKDLSVSEAAFLVGLLPAPSRFSTHANDREEGLVRQKLVLAEMLERGVLEQSQHDAALDQQLAFQRDPAIEQLNNFGPHFAMMVRDELLERYGSEAALAESGITVKTTLNLDWQKTAEQTVRDQVNRLARNRVSNGAAVVTDPQTGQILALVGSKNWFEEGWGAFNVATAARQPGSSFKPIVYAAAMERNLITPATVLHDKPTTYANPWETYSPKNYDGKFRGDVTVRRALSNSLNVPAVEVINTLKVADTVSFANKMGLTTIADPKNYGLSLALGAGEVRLAELTNAYATFANGGRHHELATILSITDKFGQPLYEFHDEANYQAVPSDVAFLISSMLSDNGARSEVFGKALTIDRPAAVKTGTTSSYKDAWTMGYTPHLAIGTWVGNNDGRPMDHVAGALGPAPMWKNLMQQLSADLPKTAFTPPESVTKLALCGRDEFFRGEFAPSISCPKPKPNDESKSKNGGGESSAVAAEPVKPPAQGGGDDSVVPPGHEMKEGE